MSTTTTATRLPCDECDARSQDLRAAGFTVLGCTPDPTQTGVCTLRFERAAVEVAVRAAAANAIAATIAAAGNAPPEGLSPLQRRAAQGIVNQFETGSVRGDYGAVTVLPGDTGHLTYGRSQTTLSSGLLGELLARYAATPGAVFGARLAPWLPRLQAKDTSLDADLRLHNSLRACADDPLMRNLQDQFFDHSFWQPAFKAATALGLRTPLSAAVVYDSHVHGSWRTISREVTARIGTPSAVGETAWVSAYVNARLQWLLNHPNRLLRSTRYRMDAFLRLIELGNWALALPFVVRGSEVSEHTLNATPPNCYDGPEPGTRPLQLLAPMARGRDVRLVQLQLSDAGVPLRADGVFGQGLQAAVRQRQAQLGVPATGLLSTAEVKAWAASA
jgi:chitosanase